MIIKWKKTFDASHRIYEDYHGKCHNLHGHTYHVEIEIEGIPDKRGILVDFNLLKELVHNFYDHKIILHKMDPLAQCLKNNRQSLILLNQNPTAENIAKQIACNLMGNVLNINYINVCVYETVTQGACFNLKRGQKVDIEWEVINFQ